MHRLTFEGSGPFKFLKLRHHWSTLVLLRRALHFSCNRLQWDSLCKEVVNTTLINFIQHRKKWKWPRPCQERDSEIFVNFFCNFFNLPTCSWKYFSTSTSRQTPVWRKKNDNKLEQKYVLVRNTLVYLYTYGIE